MVKAECIMWIIPFYATPWLSLWRWPIFCRLFMSVAGSRPAMTSFTWDFYTRNILSDDLFENRRWKSHSLEMLNILPRAEKQSPVACCYLLKQNGFNFAGHQRWWCVTYSLQCTLYESDSPCLKRNTLMAHTVSTAHFAFILTQTLNVVVFVQIF